MKKLKIIAIILIFWFPAELFGQDQLLESLFDSGQEEVTKVEGTFKGSRIINGHSVELRNKGILDVFISHRFGRVNTGAYQFFGLDQANMRLGVEYGVNDKFNVGLGRSSFQKVFDGYLKYKILEQQTGLRNVPISMVLFTNMTANSLRLPLLQENFNNRLGYTFQALFARKFNQNFSLQISPTMVRRNFTNEVNNRRDIYAIGIGSRYLLTKRTSFNWEYFYRLNPPINGLSYNAFSVGFDIETGGHVFQLHLTNAQSMIESGFIPETTGNFFKGDIHFGFNISRTFQVN